MHRAESLSCKVSKLRPDVSDLKKIKKFKKKNALGRKRQQILDSLRHLSSEMQLTKSNRSATTLQMGQCGHSSLGTGAHHVTSGRFQLWSTVY